MATVIVNRSSKEATLSRAVIKKIVDYVCELENREILGKLSIAFVSLDEIRALKKEFFHQNIDTDVISFFYGTEEPDEVWGEIIICPKKQENMLTPMGLNMKMNKSYSSFMVFYIYWVTMTLTRKNISWKPDKTIFLSNFLLQKNAIY